VVWVVVGEVEDNFMEDVSVEDVGVEGEVQDAGRGRGRRRSLG
jgi:hypothetical protein